MKLILEAFAQEGSEAGREILNEVAKGLDFDLGNLFGWAIGVGAVLAMGAIIWGGILYSTSELVHKQDEGKELIFGAIWGLGLLILAYIILNTINPDLLKF